MSKLNVIWKCFVSGLLRAEHLRRSIPAMLDQALVSLAAFATVAILARAVGEAELGYYYLPFTVLLWTTNLQGELVTSAYAVYRQRMRGQELAEYTGSVVFIELLVAASATLIFALLALVARNHPVGTSFAVLCIAGPLWQIRAFCRYFSFANFRFGSPLFMDLVTTAVQVLLMLLLAWLGALRAPVAHAVLGLASAAGIATFLSLFRTPICIRPRRVWQDWKRNWSFTQWALASQLIGCATPYVIPWLVDWRLGEQAAGRYAAGVNLCGIASLFVLGIAHSLTPHAAKAFSDGGVPALRRVLAQTTLAFIAGLGTFAFGIALMGDQLMQMLYGGSFAGMQTVVTLLALAALINSLAIVAGNGLWAMDRPRTNLWADAVTCFVTLTIAWFGCQVWGLAGAAAAILTGNLAGTLTRLGLLWLSFHEQIRLAVRLSAQE